MIRVHTAKTYHFLTVNLCFGSADVDATALSDSTFIASAMFYNKVKRIDTVEKKTTQMQCHIGKAGQSAKVSETRLFTNTGTTCPS